MLVSIIFSVVIFRVSSNELNNGLNRQTRALRQLGDGNLFPTPLSDLDDSRISQLESSNHNLKINLIYLNFGILILSAFGSYFLARYTLEPMEKAMEAQNRFSADASHELRTPLTAMKTEIEVNLRDKNFNLKEAKSILKSNLEEISKLESLSNALLQLARLEETKVEDFEKVFLKKIIQEVQRNFEPLAYKKAIVLETNLRNLQIRGDTQSLKQLFSILLDNAIKYSSKKSKIKLSLKKTDHKVLFKIQDQGTGIKASDLPYIFERFYRADTSRSKEKTDGYGLGLSIAKQIVDLHKGKIRVFSTPGEGTSFSISLPAN